MTKYRVLNYQTGVLYKGNAQPGLFDNLDEARAAAEAHAIGQQHRYDMAYEVCEVVESTQGTTALPWKKPEDHKKQ